MPVDDTDPWSGYLQRYHGERPGITEQAFAHARYDPYGGRAGAPAGDGSYGWLVRALPLDPGDVLDVVSGSAALQRGP